MSYSHAVQVESLNRSLSEVSKDLQVSFEFFPPNSPAMEEDLVEFD